jgi:hypothetical protein
MKFNVFNIIWYLLHTEKLFVLVIIIIIIII